MRLEKGSKVIVVPQRDLLPQSLPTEKLPLLSHCRAIVRWGGGLREGTLAPPHPPTPPDLEFS